jgi:EPS-associated MarR family transcriptional regulator
MVFEPENGGMELAHADTRSRQARLQEDTYFRVMRLLQDDPDLTQRELAQRLGVSVGALNYCLRALIAKGWVKMQNFGRSRNKFGYAYILTPIGVTEKAALTRTFLRRKLEEYEALKKEIDSLSSEVGPDRTRHGSRNDDEGNGSHGRAI